MEISIDIVLLLIIAFIIGVLVAMQLKKYSSEHIVNLDDSRKVELSKCCTEPKCYNKPPHLRESCPQNKEEAKKELDKEFQQMYTQEEYYKKLDELGITKEGQLTNKNIDEAYVAKMNEKVVVNPKLDEKTDTIIRKDDRDEVRGYDLLLLAPWK
jgi:uncharacterized membrane protein YraQ (UPF0718 family)